MVALKKLRTQINGKFNVIFVLLMKIKVSLYSLYLKTKETIQREMNIGYWWGSHKEGDH
jgi:hypothetical protein